MRRILTILTLITVVGLPSWARFSVSGQIDEHLHEEDDNTEYSEHNNNSTSWGRDTTRGKQIPLPMGVFQWKVDKRLGTVINAENTDTVVHNFQNWKMQDGMRGTFSHTGNTGSARLNRIFMDRREDRDFIFLTPLDYFRGSVSDFLFTNTKSPITNLAYHSTGGQTNGEDRVRGNFATNINKVAGVGFLLDYNYARGYYSNQQNSQFGAILYGYYRGERYNMHTYFNANHMKNAENGGLTEDTYITEPWIYQQKFDSKDIPVNISSTWNMNDDENFYLTHRYNLGYDREIEVPDSLKPTPPSDAELLEELSDSVRVALSSDSIARQLIVDSLRTKWISELVPPTEFVSVASIIHTFQLRHLNHTFHDQGKNSDFYTNQYWGHVGHIKDRTDILSVRNTVGLSMNEGFKKWVKMGMVFFATHEYRNYGLPVHLPDTMYQNYDSEHEILVGAEIRKAQGNTLHYNVDGELCLAGPNIGDFDIKGEGELNFRLGKRDTATLAVRAHLQNQKPTYLLRNYRNAYVQWNNNHLSRQFRTGIQGEIKYNRTRTKLRFGWENLTNYTYLAMENTLKPNALPESVLPADYTHNVAVRQSDTSIEVFTASLSQDLVWKFFGWENEVTFQYSTNKDILPLPAINIYSNIYLQFRIAKVLNVQLGADIRYFTSYHAPDYFGAVGMFAVQDTNHTRITIGNYPIINAYANFHLKHCRFYVNVAHLNAGAGNMFLVPHMPMNPLNVSLGVSWNFFN